MTERVISYATKDKKGPVSIFIDNASPVPLPNGQEFLVREKPLILPSESSEALISLPYLDRTNYEHPYYVNTEGFIVGPRKIGKHAWLVGRQEHNVGTIPLNANTLLVGNILIDPGSHEGIPYLLENLNQLGKDMDDIELVLITHAHLDHMEAIDDLQMLGLIAPVLVPDKSVDQIIHEDAEKIGMDMYQHDFHSFRIDSTLIHNDSFENSGFKITAKDGPGHSPDHMYYEITDEEGHKTFVVGDILVGGERPQFGSDKTAWKETLRTLMSEVRYADGAFESDDIVTGHHPTELHKTPNLLYEVSKFGTKQWDIVPSQPGMIMSWWA